MFMEAHYLSLSNFFPLLFLSGRFWVSLFLLSVGYHILIDSNMIHLGGFFKLTHQFGV